MMRLFVLGLLLVLVDPRPAAACKCIQITAASAVKNSDAVFFGKVTRIDGDVVTVAVKGVWKGDVAKTTTLSAGKSSCGLLNAGLRAGKLWVFAARRGDDGVLHVRQCDGSRRAMQQAIAAFTQVAGDPKSPS
jgi:hypothetical protein